MNLRVAIKAQFVKKTDIPAMIHKNLVFLCILIWTPLSHSARVGKISIKGNKIIETGLIRPHIHLKEGAPYSKRLVQKDVRRLFSLGFFDDITVRSRPSKKGLNIVYEFKERLHIGQVEFKGNKGLRTEDLKELSEVRGHGFLNFNELQNTISAIKEKYKEKGYYLAEVSYKTKRIPKKKQLRLIIEIREKHKLFVKRVHFIGNRNISSDSLKAFMQTKEQNILSFFGSSGTYQPQSIERDLQFIEYYYRDQGYLNIRVQQPEISITPDKKFVYVAFPVSEGLRFKMGKVAFRGDEVVPAEQVQDRWNLKEGEYFSLGKLQKDIQLLSLLYKNKGYAFVKVQPQFFPDPAEEDKIHILFQVEKGEIYKLRRIQVKGNKSTRDKVILRRTRLKEGEIYNESKRELTSQLVQQLGYFEKVSVQPVPVTTEKNNLDLIVQVKERENTGEAQLAGGYNSQIKLFIQGGVKKQNFLGLGHSIALNVNFSKYQEVLALSYESPYFLDSRWNFDFDVFNMSQSAFSGSQSFSPFALQSQDYLSYFQLDTGFSLSFGRHMTKFLTLFLKYKLQNQLLSGEPVYYLRDLPVLSPLFDFLFGVREGNEEISFKDGIFDDIYDLKEGKGLNSSLSAIMEYDARNDRYYASRGFFTRLSAEYSGLGGDFKYTKLEGGIRHYHSPFWKFVIKNRLEFGSVFSNDKQRKAPFTELFLLGGPYNLRGFRVYTQGPRRYSEKAYDYALRNKLDHPEAFANRPYGGSQMLFYSLELEFPIVERAELRGAFFFDIGEANDTLEFDLGDQLRANVGAGIRWKSPFGPIGLDWAVPYKPRKKFLEEDWEIQFSIGSQF